MMLGKLSKELLSQGMRKGRSVAAPSVAKSLTQKNAVSVRNASSTPKSRGFGNVVGETLDKGRGRPSAQSSGGNRPFTTRVYQWDQKGDTGHVGVAVTKGKASDDVFADEGVCVSKRATREVMPGAEPPTKRPGRDFGIDTDSNVNVQEKIAWNSTLEEDLAYYGEPSSIVDIEDNDYEAQRKFTDAYEDKISLKREPFQLMDRVAGDNTTDNCMTTAARTIAAGHPGVFSEDSDPPTAQRSVTEFSEIAEAAPKATVHTPPYGKNDS